MTEAQKAKKREYNKTYRQKHFAKEKARQQAWIEANREYHIERCRQNNLRRRGLNAATYAKLLAEQGGVCAVCKCELPEDQTRFYIDHDHSCCPRNFSCPKCIRGLLCKSCNLVLGYSKDKPDVLRAAAEYLERFQVVAVQ